MRVGLGYDVHKLVEDRKLILGGVEVPHTLGLLGHSDADVLVHAIMDALLGAAALGDIGKHFPDTDPEYKGADSMKLMAHVRDLIEEKGYVIENIDATVIAQNFGFSETFIGLTVVALGTSLPELVTSVVAAKKGENDLALGNVVGSNIFNILLVLGLSAAICPITIESVAMIDMAILIVVSAFGYLLARTKSEVSRKEGFLFILIYIIYFGYIFVR